MPYNISIGLYVGALRTSTLSATVGDVLRIFGLSLDQGRGSTVQWQRDGVDISGETDDTYTVVEDDEGTVITAEVTFTDTSTAVTSPGATIAAETVTVATWDVTGGEGQLTINSMPPVIAPTVVGGEGQITVTG